MRASRAAWTRSRPADPGSRQADAVHCAHFEAARCRSCTWLPRPYAEQLAAKQRIARDALGDPAGLHWLPPLGEDGAGFRNRAKMVVAGRSGQPLLGILNGEGAGVDLRDCALYPPALQAAFGPIARLITAARIEPYDVPRRRGELKYVLVTLAEHSGELMIRFVLRSEQSLPRLRAHLPRLQAELPNARVLSANLQPIHQAVLEGPEEILLGADDAMALRVNGLLLWLGPQAFFQTHTRMAASLYAQARTWIEAINPPAVLDLYCGIGGFAMHCADGRRAVYGIELSASAVALAQRAARDNGLRNLTFAASDAATTDPRTLPPAPAVIVNPPRRGLDASIRARLQADPDVRWLVYSSCHVHSLARDLAALPAFRLREAQVLDLFPHTPHFELLCLLERSP